MSVEDFSVSSIEWLRDSHFDEKVFGKPGKLLLYSAAVLLWIYMVSWIYKDAEYKYFEGSKAKYIWLVVAVFAAPVAWFVYLILRPSSDLDEAYLQRVEERYLAFESRGLGYCAKCEAPVDPDYIYCAKCGTKVRSRCKKCEKLVESHSEYCSNCGEKQPRKAAVTVIGLNESEKDRSLPKPKTEKKIEKPASFFEKLGEYFSKATSSFATAFLPKKEEKSEKKKKEPPDKVL